jgi:hypothetical protein
MADDLVETLVARRCARKARTRRHLPTERYGLRIRFVCLQQNGIPMTEATSHRITRVTALLFAGAVTVAIAGAPTASAAPVTKTVFSLLLGSTGSGSSSENAFVNESMSVTTDAELPGFSRFSSSSECYCTVSWTNHSTGDSGQWKSGGTFDAPSTFTGSGNISATAAVTSGITFLPGQGSWIAP